MARLIIPSGGKQSGVVISSPTTNHARLNNLDYEHSGHTGFQSELTFDNLPQANSDNPVKSGGVYSALAAKYDKPQTGIPKNDLSSDVQLSLQKADTAVQDISGKVDKVSGKELSQNDYTDEDKAIVDGVTAAIAGKADKTEIPTRLSELNNDNHTVTDEHYVHTDNNYTSSEKTKLSRIVEGAEVNVQADWNVNDANADTFIKNKPDLSLKANVSEVYNKAEIDDKLAGKQNELTFDDEPAYTSTNPVTSEGIWFKFADVYDALDVKEDVPTINEDYSSGVAHVALDFITDNNKIYLITSDTVSDITVYIANGEYPKDFIFQVSLVPQLSAPQIVYDASNIINWVGTDCSVSGTYSIFAPVANKHYDIIFYFNGSQFIGLVNGYVPAGGNS